MRLRTVAENLVEHLVLKLNQVPEPLVETQVAFSMARSVMTGVKLGLFESVADEPRSASEIANACSTHPGATEKLLNALTSCGYFTFQRDRYALRPKTRKWLLRRSPKNLCDKLLFQFYEWEMVGGYETFVRTGAPHRTHSSIVDSGYWDVYQKGMRNLAALWADDVATRFPALPKARDMLDIGGSHGYFSVCLCRKFAGLKSIILDLPEAIKHAAPLLAQENMGDRITHRSGDALTDDLGEHTVDIVFLSQLVHHFTDIQNRELMKRIARALRPQGVCVILDSVSAQAPGGGDQTAALLDLYFAMLSESGTWSIATMQDWFRAAGLVPLDAIRFRNMPGGALVSGRKPA